MGYGHKEQQLVSARNQLRQLGGAFHPRRPTNARKQVHAEEDTEGMVPMQAYSV